MFVCENPGGQKMSTWQAGNPFFFPNFQTVHTNQVFKGTKEISGRLESTKLISLLCCQSLSTIFCSGVLHESGPISIISIPTQPSILTVTIELVMYQCRHSNYCMNGAVHKTNAGFKNDLLQELRVLSCDLRKKRELMLLFSPVGLAKKNSPGRIFTNKPFFLLTLTWV